MALPFAAVGRIRLVICPRPEKSARCKSCGCTVEAASLAVCPSCWTPDICDACIVSQGAQVGCKVCAKEWRQ